jgi:hypothetical protein
VRRLLAAFSVVIAGCSSSPPSAPLPGPAPELVIIRASGGGYAVLETRTGHLRASLPAGILALGLSDGGDVGEAYLISPAAAGGTGIARVAPDRSFALEPLATQGGPAAAAILAGAPGLSSFVGPPTVLTVLAADGRLFGYQHGSLLWSDSASVGQQLAGVGDETLLLGPRGWQRVLLDTGGLGPVETAPGCLPGPLAIIAGQVVYDCVGRLSRGDVAVPAGRPIAFAAGGVEVLAFPNGELWRVDGAGARRTGSTSAWTVAPVPSADGSLLYLPSASGIDRVDAGSGNGRRLVGARGISSLALSRDANYLYALFGDSLHTYATGSGSDAGSVVAAGDLILAVAGG